MRGRARLTGAMLGRVGGGGTPFWSLADDMAALSRTIVARARIKNSSRFMAA